jgi:hypothetical protein
LSWQLTLTKLRSSLFHIYQTHFTDEERKAFQLWPTRSVFHYTPGFIYGLIATNVVAAATTIYLIWQAPYVLEWIR